MGKMLFGPPGDFTLQYCEWPLAENGSKAERRRRILVLKYIHDEDSPMCLANETLSRKLL